MVASRRLLARKHARHSRAFDVPLVITLSGVIA